jgi:hypothetical protein
MREDRAPFRWTSRPMGLKVDLADKDAVERALQKPPKGN